MKTVPAAEFKAHCLSLLEKVRKTSQAIVVTKHGKPVACVQPYIPPRCGRRHLLRGSVLFEGDLVSPIDVEWEAGRRSCSTPMHGSGG